MTAANTSRSEYVRALTGLVTVVALLSVVALAIYLFRGGTADSAPITVVSPRAGLVMDPGAKVKMLGVEVGRVSSIEARPDGQAVIHLAIDQSELPLIPSNVGVQIASSTVFGAKSVRLVLPTDPASDALRAGQTLGADHVVVEIDTVFEKLTSTLSAIDPAKLNETLGAVAAALNGRGEKFGQTLSDVDELLATLNPSLANLSHEIATAPPALAAIADAAPDLMDTLANASRISQTIVDEQRNLDAILLSAIGLADIGSDVIGTNGQPLTDLLHILVPTTDLTNRYHEALTCGLQAVAPLTIHPVPAEPGVVSSVGTVLGLERYRYPTNLPKVGAKGGPNCASQKLPNPPAGFAPPFVVTDVGTNPAQYSNPGILLNSDGLKQILFGPIAGPPRNSAQIGMPG